MELSLNILLDALSDANPLCYTKDKSRTFSGVRLLGKAQDADPGKLVICGLSQALNAPSEYQACVVAAVIDTELPKNAATMQNMVLFDTEMDAVQFFMIVPHKISVPLDLYHAIEFFHYSVFLPSHFRTCLR